MLSMLVSMMVLRFEEQEVKVLGFDDERAARAFVASRPELLVVLGDCEHPTPFWVVSRPDARFLCEGGYELAPDQQHLLEN